MHEGPRQFGQQDQESQNPFDILSSSETIDSLEKQRHEREEKERQEKDRREADKKRKREEDLAKKLSKTADKQREAIKDLDKSKRNLVKKSDKVKENINELKDEVDKTAKEIKKEGIKGRLASEVVSLQNGMEFVDDKLQEGGEVTIELVKQIEVAEDVIEHAEEVVETASEAAEELDPVTNARQAIEQLQSEAADVGSTVIDAEIAQRKEVEGAVMELSSAAPDIRDLVSQSWGTDISLDPEAVESNELDYFSDTFRGADADSADILPKVHQADDINVDSSINDDAVKQRLTRPLRTGTSFINSWLIGRKSQTEKISQATRDLQQQTTQLETNIERINAQAQNLAYQQPLEATLPRPVAPNIADGPQTKPETRQEIGSSVESALPPLIPYWVKSLEAELKSGRLPALKKWQKEVLNSQYPQVLEAYKKLDTKTSKSMKVPSREKLGVEKSKEALYARDEPNDVPTREETKQPSPAPFKVPEFMRERKPSITLNPIVKPNYQYSTSGNIGASQAVSGYTAVIILGGIMFGAALIVAFGI